MARTRTTYPNFDDLLLAWRNHLESGAPPENCAGWKTRNDYISSCGEIIYSYGEHYPLARRIVAEDSGEFVFVVNAVGYSSTTAKHIREALNRLRPSVGYVSGPTRQLAGAYIAPATRKEWVMSLIDSARKSRATANRCRSESLRNWRLKFTEKCERDAQTLAGWLGVSLVECFTSIPENASA